jgi:hypothetical protein
MRIFCVEYVSFSSRHLTQTALGILKSYRWLNVAMGISSKVYGSKRPENLGHDLLSIFLTQGRTGLVEIFLHIAEGKVLHRDEEGAESFKPS